PDRCRRPFGPASPCADPQQRAPGWIASASCRAHRAAQPSLGGRKGRVDAEQMVWVAAGFDEGAHGIGGFRLAQQNAVRAAAEDLAELPCIEPYIRLIRAVDRRF